jgi:serine/threonine protein kinase/Flp pilus assembly protein TadD
MKTCPQCATSYDDTQAVCPRDSAQLIKIVTDGSDPMLGKILAGRFLLVDKLGQGGMGTVYKAVHTQMDRICALKLLSPLSADTESAIARFKREARMASRIDNPHAVTIYDFGQAEDGLLYLAMEYIDGKPLTRLLADEQGLGITRTVHITKQIAQALTAAHSLGIVHRDLKPDNIMVSQKGTDSDYVKVLDFGIAKTVADDTDNVTKTGFILGTPVYMSPEQLTGEKLDGRSDVYSLAIIVYEMLSGQLPFDGDNVQAIMIKRVTNDPIRLRQATQAVSESVEEVVMSGLARDREARIATAEAFASLLIDAQHGGTQAMSGSATNQIAEQGGRQTNPITERQTVITGTPGQGFTAGDAPEAFPHTLEQTTAPVISEQKPAPQTAPVQPPPVQPPPIQPLPPAANFVTQPSTSFEAMRADATPPPQPISNNAPTTIDLRSEAPAYSGVPYSQQQQFQPRPAPKKSSKGFLILAVVLVVGVIAIGAAYFLYSRINKSNEVPAASSPQPNPGSDQEAAKMFYESGKGHQQQAYLLENSGSKAEAQAENEKAIAEYRKAIAAKPDFAAAHENLGVALYNLGRLDEAIKEYDTAIRQYGKPTAQVLTNQGLALLGLKLYEEAASSFVAAREIDPNDHDLDYYIGFAYHYSGDTEGAKAAFRRYLSNVPDGPYAKEVREVLAGRAVPVIPAP